jgi:hypothetical protein
MPLEPVEAKTEVEVTGVAPPPPGKVTVTLVAKLFGLIPAPGVKVSADTIEAVTDASGTASLILDEGVSYTVRLTAWWIQTEEFKIEKAAEAKVEIAVMPSILLWTAGSAGLGGLTYVFTEKVFPSALVGGAVFSIWPIMRYMSKR